MEEEFRTSQDSTRLASFFCFDATRPYRQPTASNGSSNRRRSTPAISNNSPGRMPVKPSKRKQDIPSYEPIYVESCLVQLCRGRKWGDAVERLKTRPEEVRIVPLPINDAGDDVINEKFHRHFSKRSTLNSSSAGSQSNSVRIFRETALGICCASEEIGNEEIVPLICALVEADPTQVGASQLVAGHTALRDAILNESCTPDILKILIDASFNYPDGTQVFHLKDRDGLSLMDHLIMAVHLGSLQHAIEIMKVFLTFRPSSSSTDVSPLIRLLTMGNSVGMVLPAKQSRTSASCVPDSENISSAERVLEATKLILDDDPKTLFHSSRVTGCSPLHLALRNYGNYECLIEEIVNRDTSNENFKLRNSFGDLPIHVACSVGAPLSMLRLIVERTILAAGTLDDGKLENGNGRVNPLIWSVNNSGYTPVDLEWVRHIESGNGFYSSRIFYPLEARGVRRHCSKQDEYYKDLLRETVNQVMETSPRNSHTVDREQDARRMFGFLIDRISLIIQAAVLDRPDKVFDAQEPASLVDTCRLCVPLGPTLPLPILELFLWIHSDKLLEKDRYGMLPIHYALNSRFGPCDSSFTASTGVEDWQIFVSRLLDEAPCQCRMETPSKQLPLHLILGHNTSSGSNVQNFSSVEERQKAWHAVIEKLVTMFPESVDQRDSVSGFYPFMIASLNPMLSLDTTYHLLRHSPSRCITTSSTPSKNS